MSADPQYDEKELLLRVAEGDESAFTHVFNLYARLLFPFLTRITKSKAVAEELIQEVLLRVWINRDKLPELKQPRSWIFRIASNLAYTWMHKKALEDKIIGSRPEEEGQLSAETTLSYKELQEKIQKAVRRLPPRRQLIYQLSRNKGLTLEEIAQQLRISKSTVKNTLSNALKSIREYLEQSGYLLLVIYLLLIKK